MELVLNVKAIKHLMVEHEIETQVELAQRLGMTRNAVSEMMRGERKPTLDTISALCRVLECTPNDILMEAAHTQPLAPSAERVLA